MAQMEGSSIQATENPPFMQPQRLECVRLIHELLDKTAGYVTFVKM